jgi:hypothetical protein
VVKHKEQTIFGYVLFFRNIDASNQAFDTPDVLSQGLGQIVLLSTDLGTFDGQLFEIFKEEPRLFRKCLEKVILT